MFSSYLQPMCISTPSSLLLTWNLFRAVVPQSASTRLQKSMLPKMYGIGKKKVFKVLQHWNQLEKLGDVNATKESVLEESTKFVAACYGIKINKANLSEARFSLWAKQTKKKLCASLKPPKLESLPPTTEVFNLNVMRAHFQACIWNSCLDEKPPEMDPVEVQKRIICSFLKVSLLMLLMFIR